eukprot:gene7597-11920_t
MLLRFCNTCDRYTIHETCTDCKSTTRSGHPARFTPEDKFSKHRVAIKKKHNILPSQLPEKPL